MLVTLGGMIIDSNFDAKNALFPMLSSFDVDGLVKVTRVKLDVFSNVYFPMLVTLGGMVIDFKLDAPMKALSPMLVTLDGMAIKVKLDV